MPRNEKFHFSHISLLFNSTQEKHDHEVIEFQANAAMQNQHANVDLIIRLDRIKEQCEHRIRVCVDETKVKLEASKQVFASDSHKSGIFHGFIFALRTEDCDEMGAASTHGRESDVGRGGR